MRLARRHLLVSALLTASGVPSWARLQVPAEVQGELPDARLQGSARMRYFGLHVYDARLWVGPGFAPASFSRHALALELTYGRALDGRLIAERSLAEMQRLERLPTARAQTWLADMTAAFPDVAAGDRITGILRSDQRVRFFVNGRLRHELDDPTFGPLFFGIWLSPRTSEPAMRASLLATSADAP